MHYYSLWLVGGREGGREGEREGGREGRRVGERKPLLQFHSKGVNSTGVAEEFCVDMYMYVGVDM